MQTPIRHVLLTELAEQHGLAFRGDGDTPISGVLRLKVGVHKLRVSKPGFKDFEISVAIAASSPHREAAFEAGKWLIDSVKQVVPIWKKENWADGQSQWVHPGLRLRGLSEGGAAS